MDLLAVGEKEGNHVIITVPKEHEDEVRSRGKYDICTGMDRPEFSSGVHLGRPINDYELAAFGGLRIPFWWLR